MEEEIAMDISMLATEKSTTIQREPPINMEEEIATEMGLPMCMQEEIRATDKKQSP